MWRWVWAAALTLPLAAAGSSDSTAYLIADFEGPSALQNWRFEGIGSLALGPGYRDHGAVLAYRLPCERDGACDAYAAAMVRPSSPFPKRHKPAISLWVRFLPDVEVSVLAKDSGGHSVHFPIEATIENRMPGDWQYVVAVAADSVKGRLVEIGVLVHARVRGTVQGSVSFDDIRLRESTETFQVDPAAPAIALPADSQELAPRLGVNIHLLRDDHSLDLAHAAGFGLVRMDMLWANVERGGRFRFFAYDALLRALDARGMSVLWILDYGHPDHGGSVPRTSEDVAAFARFAEAAAVHFKGRNVRYEIWNEPNTSQFWAPSPNPSEYAVLLRAAVAAIRGADPPARISTGGVSRIDGQFVSRTVDRNLAEYLTAIGIHPYPRAGPESIAPELELLRAWMARALGERLEIWDTEWGYSSANAPKDAPSNGHTAAGRRRQAALSVRELLTVWALGLPLAVWYDLRDDGTDAANPEHNYGLLDSSGNEKPAMVAIRTLMTAATSHKSASMIRETPAGIHAMRLNGPGDTVWIVWTDQPGGRRTVEYPKQNLVSATELMGEAVKSKDGPAGQARVEINEVDGPIYLRWKS